jgi:hypothetical protein
MKIASVNVELSCWGGHLSPRAGRGRIALAIRVRGSLRERGRDCFENAHHITQHVVVPEPQNTIIVISKPFVADRVARAVRVLAPIDLNNETIFPADEIDRIRTDRLLPNELIIVESARTEPMPQSALRVGRNLSPAPRSSGLDLISSSHVETPPHPDCFAIRPLPARGERLASRAIQ